MRHRPPTVREWVSALLGVVLAVIPAAADDAIKERGLSIWKNQCIECHGTGGEGVDGKYDEPLYGNWSLEKLTRIIHKTMPEDDPEKCVDEDAEAVALYIYDAFYSMKARARNTPARVELVRLTNRQYLNTAADLLRPFVGDSQPGRERGLRAVYYSARNFDGKERKIERVDAQVQFDFGEFSPDPEQFKDEEFSIQWSGSLLAPETGDYEFTVRSENGFRLWVNQNDVALIDGWVSSGRVLEQSATIRLIGGRAYPLRLDFFKFKDKSASVALQWKPPHGVRQTIPARHLTPQRVNETLVITTPFPPDDSSVGYERGVAVSRSWDEAATHAAIEVANHVLTHLNRLAGTKDDADDREQKIREFCGRLVETAFRRPLTEEQRAFFVESQFEPGTKIENSVKRVILLTLKSPRFLYLGLQGGPVDDFEIASRLAAGLWDSLPDSTLNRLAKEGRLKEPALVAAQARRMLDDPRARAKMRDFLHHWLQLDHVESLVKDSGLFPTFTPEVVADLRTSLELFLDDAVWSRPSDFRELLLADYLFVNERLAKFYGIDREVDDFTKVILDDRQRSGVITHPYLLAMFSYPKTTSPIHRGVFLTRNVVGRALKPPPMAIEFKDNDFPEDLTMREKVAELTRDDACQSCHSVINPLGFSLENYDAVGRWRTEENRRPIDAASDYPTHDGRTVRLNGARDLAEFAAASDQAQKGFIEQLFHQVVKQPMLAYGPRVQDELHRSFVDSDFNVQQLLVNIATLAALHDDTKLAIAD
ncbi:MAG TPA: hypothetical protein DCY13_06095 [Verrucomicrobiales bacterium]|nr:hypothetical protein [Verrucomicrobiales bacterium]